MSQKAEASISLLAQPMAITGKSPLWDERRQCLWWIDIQAQRLLRTEPDGRTEAVPVPSQPGFVALADSGRLVLGLENGLWTYEPEKRCWAQQSRTESDRPTLRLNDGKPDAQGRLWFGSMDMTHTGQAIGRLYRRDPSGDIEAVRANILVPNAIVPCGRGLNLLFTDSPSGRLELLDIDLESGAVIGSRLLLDAGPGNVLDSACMDAEGNFWVVIVGPGEVLHIAPSGKILQKVTLPVTRPTAPVLGGEKGNTLFITSQRRFLGAEELASQKAAGGLLAIEVSVSAAPVYRVAGL